jgi:tetratricopeptide (TPR) repeat protein
MNEMNEEFLVNNNTGGHVARARVLIEQDRFALAESELRGHILAEPDDATAHAMLALTLAGQKKLREALESARRGIHLAPMLPYAHYILAWVYDQQGRLGEAEAAISEAIRLDPEDADYFALLSSIKLERRRWQEALEAAETGLYFDSGHVGCINLRAMALNQMGLADDASVAIEGALSVEPENAFTHANRGWQEAHRGNYEQAMIHFREALRIDAELEWARAGVVEVLKARNPVYRVMLRYFLWSSRLSARATWGLIIGFYFFSRLINAAMRARPELAPLLWPLYGLYLAFVLMTWIARPLFDLLLRLDPVGRVVLSRKQITASNWVGAALLLATVGLALGLLTGVPSFYLLAAGSGMMTLPIAGAFNAETPKARKVLPAYTVALGSLALLTFALSFYDFEKAMSFGGLFLLGFFVYGWVANALSIRT